MGSKEALPKKALRKMRKQAETLVIASTLGTPHRIGKFKSNTLNHLQYKQEGQKGKRRGCAIYTLDVLYNLIYCFGSITALEFKNIMKPGVATFKTTQLMACPKTNVPQRTNQLFL